MNECAYSASSILTNVCSACSKKPKTIDRLNSRSSSSSSISRICSKVKASILSPRSGRPTDPASLCWGFGRGQFSVLERELEGGGGGLGCDNSWGHKGRGIFSHSILSFIPRRIRHDQISVVCLRRPDRIQIRSVIDEVVMLQNLKM